MTRLSQFSEMLFSSFENLTACVVVSTALTTVGCGGSGSFVWVNDVPDTVVLTKPSAAVVVGDVISVRVFGQDNLSVKSPVRTDGLIAMPLIGQVQVAGRLPSDISKEITARLAPFVNAPRVMTVIDESHIKIVVAGEVVRPGTLDLSGPVDVLTAVASAGGLTAFAGESDIYVLRQTPTGSYRIRFRWPDVSRGEGNAARFLLRDKDQIMVE